MNAVVLAGGVRSGLEVPGSGVPRALWPFPDQPLISHVLRFLHTQGCQRIAVCANGKTKMIAAELAGGTTPWMDLHYSEDRLPRGPAGCLRDLQEWLGEETFVALQGTAHYAFDLHAMAEQHRKSGAAITVGARICNDDPDLLEPVGVYLVEPRALHLINTVGFQDFKEQFLPKVIAAGMTVRCHTLQGKATLIHSPSHYLAAIGDAILCSAKELPEGFTERAPGVIVHRSAVIHPTVRLTGPVWIDAHVTIDEHAVIAGPVILTPGSRVGGHALVHKAVVMKGGTIAVAAEGVSAIVGPHMTLAAQPAKRFPTSARSLVETPATTSCPAPARTGMGRFLSLFGSTRGKPAAR